MSVTQAAHAEDPRAGRMRQGDELHAERASRSRAAAPSPVWVRASVAVALLLVGSWVAWTSATFLVADVVSVSARSHVRQWSLGTLAATDTQVAAAEAAIRRAARISPDDPSIWEDMGEVQVLLAKRAGIELLQRASAPVDQATSAVAVNAAAAAASRPARTLAEFRRRARNLEMEAQRRALQGSAPATAPVPEPSASAPPSLEDLKGLMRTHLEAARDAYERSLKLRPDFPTVWARIAGVYSGLEQRELYLQAWRKALKLGPYEGNVQAECLELVLLDWDQAEPDQAEWATNLFESANPAKRSAINKLAERFGIRFNEDTEVPSESAPASAPGLR